MSLEDRFNEKMKTIEEKLKDAALCGVLEGIIQEASDFAHQMANTVEEIVDDILEEQQAATAGHEFFVIMQKRRDGKVYADLHKTDGQFYLTYEEADFARDAKILLFPEQAYTTHVVKLIATDPQNGNS